MPHGFRHRAPLLKMHNDHWQKYGWPKRGSSSIAQLHSMLGDDKSMLTDISVLELSDKGSVVSAAAQNLQH